LWFDDLTSGYDPFNLLASPGQHKEFLIFKLPLATLYSLPLAAKTAKIKNTDPIKPATSLEWSIKGNFASYQVVDQYNGPSNSPNSTFTSFTPGPDPNDPNCTLLTWSGASIAPNDFAEVGILAPGTSVETCYLGLDPNSLLLCAHDLNVDSAGSSLRGGVVRFVNSAAGCESTTTLYVGNVSVEWYVGDMPALPDHVPEAASVRHPALRHSGSTPVPLAPGNGTNLKFAPPPMGSDTVLVTYTVGTTAALTGADSVVQSVMLPIPQPGSIPTLSEWGMIALVTLLLLTGAFLINRRSRQAPVV